ALAAERYRPDWTPYESMAHVEVGKSAHRASQILAVRWSRAGGVGSRRRAGIFIDRFTVCVRHQEREPVAEPLIQLGHQRIVVRVGALLVVRHVPKVLVGPSRIAQAWAWLIGIQREGEVRALRSKVSQFQ